jgi:polysaccharide export outer membrane protein
MNFSESDFEKDAASDTSSAPAKKPVLKAITPQLVKSEKAHHSKQVEQDISQLIKKVQPYSIQGGDILAITVWDHPELTSASTSSTAQMTSVSDMAAATESPSQGFVVDQDGSLQFPFAGRLKVSGMTEAQAQKALAAKLAYYIKSPVVTLRVQSYRSKRIYVDGEVKTPGVLPITDVPMSLMEALNRAGGLLPTADQSQITISRSGKNYLINLPHLVQKGINPGNVMLASGDVVRVRSRDESQIFVSGEVLRPTALAMHNGSLTLNEALGEAGGINPETGGRHIYVIRNAGDEEPVVYHLDTKSPDRISLAEQFELQPKDLVYVDAAPLASWHRTISLLLPSALSQGVSAGSSAATASTTSGR